MDLDAIQEWTSCEAAEFKALFAKLRNEKSCDRMEVLGKRFPAKTIHQLRDKYADVFADMLYGEIDDEPIRDDATSALRDWYKLLEGDTHDSVLGPSVDQETSLVQPSKHLVLKTAGDQKEVQKPHCKSSRKERQTWTAEEHRQFLHGVQHFGRGEWKSISKYFVPSRTPVQLASHAQKHFDRIKNNELVDRRQRHTINDVRLVNHGMKGKPNASSIPLPVLTEDMGNFGQASNSPSNPSPREQWNVLLAQSRTEHWTWPRKRSLGATTNPWRKNNRRTLPNVLTAQVAQGSDHGTKLTCEMVPIKGRDLRTTIPPF